MCVLLEQETVESDEPNYGTIPHSQADQQNQNLQSGINLRPYLFVVNEESLVSEHAHMKWDILHVI